MKPYWVNGRSTLWMGHVLDVLAGIEAGSVQCAITSPPYYGLRSYDGDQTIEWGPVSYAPMAGLPEIEIPGCDPECEHVWTSEKRMLHTGSSASAKEKSNGGAFHGDQATDDQWCQLCGGWRGCLGLEPTVEQFIGHIVLVARALWRVLREDGTFWLNFGDSYATGTTAGRPDYSPTGQVGANRPEAQNSVGRCGTPKGLKTKDLIGIPWRVAFALQADGWYLRSDVIWAKGVSFCDTYSGSCMPESVTDRPTRGHEDVFLLAKNERYFYDHMAVREQLACPDAADGSRVFGGVNKHGANIEHARTTGRSYSNAPSGRNLRDVWVINPGGYRDAHYATFPPALIEPMIKAGTSARGACPSCGSPWERVTERTEPSYYRERKDAEFEGRKVNGNDNYTSISRGRADNSGVGYSSSSTIGWIPTCSCYGVEIPEKLRLPEMPEDAEEPFECEACGGTGLEPALPMFPEMETPCRKCKGRGQEPGNEVWEQWNAECEEAQANRMSVLENIHDLDLETVPCVVLDPFAGSGTTLLEAVRFGRRGWGIELSQEYCDRHIIHRLEKPIAMEMGL